LPENDTNGQRQCQQSQQSQFPAMSVFHVCSLVFHKPPRVYQVVNHRLVVEINGYSVVAELMVDHSPQQKSFPIPPKPRRA
jgi:hypothetical protein